MNPLYSAMVAAISGKLRTCAKCGRRQVVGRAENGGRYHCKFCRHAFTKDELKKS